MTNSADIKTLIREQLPNILAEDESIRDFILRTVSEYYSPKQEIDHKFEEFKERVDRILDQLQEDREEQRQLRQESDRRWQENDNRWQENDRRWQEQYQQNREILEEIKKTNIVLRTRQRAGGRRQE